MLAEYNGTDLVASYTQGAGPVSRVDSSGAAAYYDFDGLGSTAGLSDVGGGYVNSYSYLPFGESLSSHEGVSNPFQFVGQAGVMHEVSGLDFMQARFYRPSGRPISKHRPNWFPGGANLYSYTNNDPTNYIDPAGLGKIPALVAFNSSVEFGFLAEAAYNIYLNNIDHGASHEYASQIAEAVFQRWAADASKQVRIQAGFDAFKGEGIALGDTVAANVAKATSVAKPGGSLLSSALTILEGVNPGAFLIEALQGRNSSVAEVYAAASTMVN